MLHGSLWMIVLRWTIRMVGLASTVILARLLAPSDFGIVAMAMIVVGMLEVLNQMGQKLAIIRLREPTREDYDSAWTISALVGLGIGGVIFAIAPFTKFYFHEPRAVAVMQCLALRAVLGGLENIGTVDFRRELQFERFFRFNALPKIVSFFVTIGLAWLLRNYWALVAGILIGQLASTLLSYSMHPHRPRFSLAKVSSLWSFSIWTLLRSIGIYLNEQIDQIVVGRIAGAASMGRYAVASDVAASPSRELNDPLVTVLYSVMARLQGNLSELRALYLRTLGWSAIICLSTSVGVVLVAPELVNLVLGSKWVDVTPLMGWLALSAGLLGLSSGAYVMFDVVGKPHIGARLQWVRLSLLTLAIAPVGLMTHSLTAIAATRLGITALFLPTLFIAAGRQIEVSIRQYISVLWRPFSAAAIMALSVELTGVVTPVSGLAKLLLDVSVGVATFSSSLLFMWSICGQPIAPEQDILAFLRNILNRTAVWLSI